jgi:hypothetical protein
MANYWRGTSAITILVKPVITFFPGMNLTLLENNIQDYLYFRGGKSGPF